MMNWKKLNKNEHKFKFYLNILSQGLHQLE